MAIASLFILTGCWGMLLNTSGYSIVDVTADPAYWGGYKPQTVYELQTDVFLQKFRGERPGTILVLSPQSSGIRRGTYYESPPTIGAYLKKPKKWPEVQQVIWKGTLIRVTSVEFEKDPVGGLVLPPSLLSIREGNPAKTFLNEPRFLSNDRGTPQSRKSFSNIQPTNTCGSAQSRNQGNV
jgi:hypothetical protein